MADLEQIMPLITRLEALKRATEECDPDDMAADGVTCAEVWRKELHEIAVALQAAEGPPGGW